MLTLAQVEAMAPDQSALAAASKLLKPSAWPLLARDAATSVVWGEAQGSGSAPYRLMFDPADRGHKCSCPSRKFPCKHVLAMMWQFAEHPDRFAVGEPEPWVAEWLSRRRPGSGRPAGKPADANAPAPSMAALDPAEVSPGDPASQAQAEAQAAQRRARAEAAREASVTAGLEALDVWIGDQLNTGLASFIQRAQTTCRTAAQRLMDVKAPGLAARLDALPGALLSRPEPLRPDFLLAELGRLHLISAAWRRREGLDQALVDDLRRSIGWSVRREDTLNDPTVPRWAGEWLVAGTRTVVQPDRLRRTETWLTTADPAAQAPRAAVLLDFTPVQVGAGEAIPAGELFNAELAFYPSSAPLRALVAVRGPALATRMAPQGGASLVEALAAHHARLAALPWLGDDLLVAGSGRIVEADGALWAVDPDTDRGLRLAVEQNRAASPLLGLTLSGLAGVWDGQILTLLSASTPHGPWFADS
ncbi:SWIM zinc finger family protein [Caulobacter sp. HMWF009]|uniref:SWIM zinc finger family protein n=1 Tax=Caulobacter sp. HMWF009 TaxID=2056846 RepID=UPI000D35E188|nr:SWIM zinc finger family protein [Caulobacter sp. HMWF009]PTS88834.1 SWIM zinc finger family protein [Caulobacter sp. HMWF009]